MFMLAENHTKNIWNSLVSFLSSDGTGSTLRHDGDHISTPKNHLLQYPAQTHTHLFRLPNERRSS